MDLIALESYYIGFADHAEDAAIEGFFTDDKDPQFTSSDYDSGNNTALKYGKYTVYKSGPNTLSYIMEHFYGKIGKDFVKNGPKYMTTALKELKALANYCNTNAGAFESAMKNKDTATATQILNGISRVVPTIIDMNRRMNSGEHPFGGETIDTPAQIKKQLEAFWAEFLKIYDDSLDKVGNIRKNEYYSKSTLKKIFKSKMLKENQAAKLRLWYEYMLFCEDARTVVLSAGRGAAN